MFAYQQPANVREEKAPAGIMRICICFREFVVDTVISGPLINIILDQKQNQKY